RVAFTLDGARDPSGGDALEWAAAAGGSVIVGAAGDPSRVELRVPAGFRPRGLALDARIPVFASDDLLAVPCSSVQLELPQGVISGTCAQGTVTLRPNAVVAPAGAPDGVVTVGDVVRLLRASVGLEDFSPDELGRGDLAPGTATGITWHATPDCAITIGDVIVALRVNVGLLTL